MKRSLLVRAGALATLGLFVAPALGDDGPTRIEPSKLPEAVRRAVDKAAPGIRLAEALSGVEDGNTRFLLRGKDGEGREVTIEAEEGGTLRRVETTISMDEVPERIRGFAEREAKSSIGTIARVKSIVEHGDDSPSYMFEGPDDGPERRAMLFPGDGASRSRIAK